jgi:hypothetical protein
MSKFEGKTETAKFVRSGLRNFFHPREKEEDLSIYLSLDRLLLLSTYTHNIIDVSIDIENVVVMNKHTSLWASFIGVR